MRAGATLLLFGLSTLFAGCVRSIDEVASLPVSASVWTDKSPAAVRDCLVLEMDKVRARPVETGSADHRELSFVGQAGAIAHYSLVESNGGTTVTAHRRKIVSDRFEQAASCYPAGEPTLP